MCNVADPESVAAAVATVVERHGTVDVARDDAGINVDGLVADLSWPDWQRCMDVNLGGTFLMSQAVAPVMQRAGRGRIINAASFAAIVPSVGSAAYAASKSAVVALHTGAGHRSSGRGASRSTRTRPGWCRRR